MVYRTKRALFSVLGIRNYKGGGGGVAQALSSDYHQV